MLVYLAALIIGAGTLGLQLFMGHDAGDAAHFEAGGGHDAAHDAASSGLAAVVLSLRFWTFGLLAFGLVGTLFYFLNVATPLATGLVASGMGLGSGLFASWTFRFLRRTSLSSGGEPGDAVGQVGKVLIDCQRGGVGKVRIELRGQTVDYLASTDDDALEPGESVLVEEVRGDTLHVSRVPEELVPRKRNERSE
jgi:membrane protein implicated in regulation of membrane protease activity